MKIEDINKRLPNIHVQRAAGDGNNAYTIEIDNQTVGEVREGRFADYFAPEGTHIMRISGKGIEAAERMFKVVDERTKLHFFTRCLFGKIDIILMSAEKHNK